MSVLAIVGGIGHAGAEAQAAWMWAVSLIVSLLVLGAFVIVIVMRSGWGDDRPGDDDGGWGRGGKGRSPEGPRRPPGEPTWWPEFEQQFAAYVATRSLPERPERRPVLV